MAAVQLDLAVCSGLHLESSYTWRLFGKFTCSALGLHSECIWTSLRTTLKALKGLQKPSKASKNLQSPHLEGLRRAFKGFERPAKASTGLQRPHFEGLQRPSKAFEGLTWKAFEGLRRLQDAPAVQQKGSKGAEKAKSLVFKTSEGPNQATTEE